MAPDSGVRAPPPSLTSDCDMPPLTGKAAAQPGGEIGRGEREKFLVGVQPAAVLGGERAADGGRLHRAEQEARERQRQQVVQVGPVNRGQAEGRQPLRHFAQQLHPARVEAEQRRSHDAADHHEQRHGFVLEEHLPEHQHRQRDAADGRARWDWFRPGA